MSIKYHQNGIGNEYGADGKLTDNWNPSTDYGNEYTQVYIRINVSSYDCAAGFFNSDASREAFYTEASNILKSFGILEDCGYSVEHSREKQAYLYVHPQNISGVIRKNDVKKVTEAFDNMENVSVRWVDLYATVYVMTDAEGYYEAYSDDGKTWCFGSQSSLKPIEETSIKGVANHLFYLNRNKHYIQRICMNCAGKSDKATDYEQLPYDTIEEIEHMEE